MLEGWGGVFVSLGGSHELGVSMPTLSDLPLSSLFVHGDSDNAARAPLHGVRVLEVGTGIAGAFAGAMLADLGAEVVLIETAIANGPVTSDLEHNEAERIAFHRNKLSVEVNLSDPMARRKIEQLLKLSDAIIEDGDNEYLASVGISEDVLTSIAPKLIRCRVSGYGQEGQGLPDSELDIQAVTGNLDLTGNDGEAPYQGGIPYCSLSAGVFTVVSLIAALLGTKRDDGAHKVDISRYDVALSLLSYMAVGYFADGQPQSRIGTGHTTIFPYNAFEASDGEFVVAAFTQQFWRNLCTAIGRIDLVSDERFGNFAARIRERAALLEILEPIFKKRTVSEWVEALELADVPVGPVLSVKGALELDQTRVRGMTPEVKLDDNRVVRVLASPLFFHGSLGPLERPLRRPPKMGENTQGVLDLPARSGEWQGPNANGLATGTDRNRLPLDGVRVLDFSRMYAGPMATEILADLGAMVIKVEEPRVGDPTRRNLPFWGQESAYFMALNRGKQSLTLDLKSKAGREYAVRLAEDADIIVENYRYGVTRRLGLDFESVRTLNPDVVYCSLSGFGESGPLRDKISFDLVNQAMAGLIDLTGGEGERPVRIGVPLGDIMGGLHLAIGAVAGLYRREMTGDGCWVDISLHDALVSLLTTRAEELFVNSVSPRRRGNRKPHGAPGRCFQTRDGWIVIDASEDNSYLQFCRVAGNPELNALRFSTAVGRLANADELDGIISRVVKEASNEEWLHRLAEVGVPASPVLSLEQAVTSDAIRRRGLVFEAVHSSAGPTKNLASPIVYDGERLGVGTVSPELGSDTHFILKQLGCSGEKLTALIDEGVIRG